VTFRGYAGVIVWPLALLIAPACHHGGSPGSVTMVITNFKFPAVSVGAGKTVEVQTTDLEGHSVTADDGSFDSPITSRDSPVRFRAPTHPGHFAIHCRVHPVMHGTLNVT
jgi:plastocyanin